MNQWTQYEQWTYWKRWGSGSTDVGTDPNPVETFYLTTEDGNVLTAENGDRLLY